MSAFVAWLSEMIADGNVQVEKGDTSWGWTTVTLRVPEEVVEHALTLAAAKQLRSAAGTTPTEGNQL